MPNEYQGQWDEYTQAHQKAESAKKSHEFLTKHPVEAKKEKLAERKQQLATIMRFYGSMKAKEGEIVGQAKDFADQNNPDNIQMYLDAYYEYFDHLLNQAEVSDDQLEALMQNISALETLVKDPGLSKEARQQLPEDLAKEIPPQEAEKIQALFVGEIAQAIVDQGGMAPEQGFSHEKLNELYHRAAELYEDGGNGPKPQLIGPVRIIKASPGWTGHAKYKN
jgi:hypothetical protein